MSWLDLRNGSLLYEESGVFESRLLQASIGTQHRDTMHSPNSRTPFWVLTLTGFPTCVCRITTSIFQRQFSHLRRGIILKAFACQPWCGALTSSNSTIKTTHMPFFSWGSGQQVGWHYCWPSRLSCLLKKNFENPRVSCNFVPTHLQLIARRLHSPFHCAGPTPVKTWSASAGKSLCRSSCTESAGLSSAHVVMHRGLRPWTEVRIRAAGPVKPSNSFHPKGNWQC